MTDALPRVLLSRWAVRQWERKSRATAVRVATLNGEAIPDEEGEVLPDGCLRIHVTLPDGRVLAEMIVSPPEWRWMQS